MTSGHKRGLSPPMKREIKRRSAIEASIGHMETVAGLTETSSRDTLVTLSTPF